MHERARQLGIDLLIRTEIVPVEFKECLPVDEPASRSFPPRMSAGSRSFGSTDSSKMKAKNGWPLSRPKFTRLAWSYLGMTELIGRHGKFYRD